MKRITTIFDKIEEIVMFIGVITILVMMFLISLDSLLRYILKSPLPDVYEVVSTYLIVAVVFLGLSYTFKNGNHINVDIVERRFPESLRRYLGIFNNLVSVIVFAVIFYESWITTWGAFIGKEYTQGIISLPMYISYGIVTLGSLFMTIRILIDAVQKFYQIPKAHR